MTIASEDRRPCGLRLGYFLTIAVGGCLLSGAHGDCGFGAHENHADAGEAYEDPRTRVYDPSRRVSVPDRSDSGYVPAEYGDPSRGDPREPDADAAPMPDAEVVDAAITDALQPEFPPDAALDGAAASSDAAPLAVDAVPPPDAVLPAEDGPRGP